MGTNRIIHRPDSNKLICERSVLILKSRKRNLTIVEKFSLNLSNITKDIVNIQSNFIHIFYIVY